MITKFASYEIYSNKTKLYLPNENIFHFNLRISTPIKDVIKFADGIFIANQKSG